MNDRGGILIDQVVALALPSLLVVSIQLGTSDQSAGFPVTKARAAPKTEAAFQAAL